jgi:hypothetical protein
MSEVNSDIWHLRNALGNEITEVNVFQISEYETSYRGTKSILIKKIKFMFRDDN